ncbi:MAG: hypothetical protein AAF696_19405, partial [Bacteroidota bacterium]
MKHLFPGFLQTTLPIGLLTSLIFLFVCGRAQTIVFSEDFEQWTAQTPSLPQAWVLGASSCSTGPSCYWGPKLNFPNNSIPAISGCGGSGEYARANNSALSTASRVSMISPSIDLRNPGSVSDVELSFCLINPSSNGLGTDRLEVFFSIDGGATWINQLSDASIYPNWANLSLSVPSSMWVNNFRIRIDAVAGVDQVDMGIDELSLVQNIPSCKTGNSSVSSSINGQVCRNFEADVAILSNTDTTGANYAYILTDALDRVLGLIPGNQIDLNILAANDFRIYGISYTGTLDVTPGQLIQTSSASLCYTLSTDFISFFVVDLGLRIQRSDYNGYEVSIAAGMDGSIEVLHPVNSNYSYTWSHDNGLSGPLATQLPEGNYRILVTDPLSGCSDELTTTLAEPAPLVGTVEITTNYNGSSISCTGVEDASLKASARGGVKPYRYVWQGFPGFGDSVLSNVGAGTYILSVIDKNNAVIQIPRQVFDPAELLIETDDQFYVCNGRDSDEIRLNVSGGTGDYSYLWSNGSTDSTLSNIAPGQLSVLITDANNCAQNFSLEILEASPIETEPISTSPQCSNQDNGSILLFTSGGMP